MLTSTMVIPTLPVVDLARARKFYEEKLGLRFLEERESGILFDCGGGTALLLYPRAPTKADNTAASFVVDDIEAAVNDLKQKGITFEEYDMPGLKTERGIATTREDKNAWFKDAEGNILALTQLIVPLKREPSPQAARAAPPAR
jgi:catechol 2,3-dioxygenase-like lactoylglutathione lyase family enzyme